MATGYIKQSTYVDGNVITASLFNEDFGALQNAFAYTTDPSTTGHTHDGSASQGGAISKIGDVDFNNKIEIDGSSNTIKFFIEVGGTTATETLKLEAGALAPVVASIDLGTSSQPFDTAFVNSITLPDSDGTTNRINFGAGTDFNIHYNANNTAMLQSTTENSVIEVDGKTGVKLKTDGTERLATTTTGVTVSGAFAVNTNTLVVDNANNRVGIGTASPASGLHVEGDGDTASKITAERTGETTGKNVLGYDYIGTFSNTDLRLFTNSTQVMVIDTSGKVGIGITSPDSKLDVAGEIRADNVIRVQGSGDGRVEVGGATGGYVDLKTPDSDDYDFRLAHTAANGSKLVSPNSDIRMSVGTQDRLTIKTDGNIGIGTTSPALFDGGSGLVTHISDDTRAALRLTTTGGGGDLELRTFGSNGATIFNSANGELRLGTNATERMRITSTGNVGIGTTTPNRPLTVEATAQTFGSTQSVLQLGDNSAMAAGVGGGVTFTGKATTGQADSNTAFAAIHGEKANGTSGNNSGVMVFSTRTHGSNPAERMRIDSSGNVGIGTDSPANTLTVGGLEPSDIFADATVGIKCDANHKGILLQENSGAEQWSMGVNANGDLNFYDSDVTDPLVTFQDNSGRVGIGTTNPLSKLHVYGGASGTDVDVAKFTSNTGAFAIKCSDLSANNPVWTLRTFDGEALAFGDGTTENMRIESSGNVGIGVTSPTGKFQIYKGGQSSYQTYTDTNSGLILQSYQSQGSPYTKTSDIVAGSDGTVPSEIRLLTRTAGQSSVDERMRISSSGNVGIGTDDPQNNLDVADTIAIIGSTSKLTLDSSGTDAVTITGSQLGATTPNTDLTLRCDKTISLQNVNLNVSGLPHNDVLTVNATGGGGEDNALTFFSKPHYPERTELPSTTDSNPTPAIGTSDAVFVYDTTKDFDGGQWRLNHENESFQTSNRTLPKTIILEGDGRVLKFIDPSSRENPFVTTTISLVGIATPNIAKIVAKNGYVLLHLANIGATAEAILLDLIENKAIKYTRTGTIEYYASKNLPIIQQPESVRYKVKSGYHTITNIHNAFLSFPKLDGNELNSNRPKVRVNLVGSTSALVSYVNKDEYSVFVVMPGTTYHGTNNQERNSVFLSSETSITELVDDYDSSFTSYPSTSTAKSDRIKISERLSGGSTLFRHYETDEVIEQMSENGLAYLTSHDGDKSLTQLIPLRSLDQYDINATSPGLLFSKITTSKVSGIVPHKSTGFTALGEKQSSGTTEISTVTINPQSYEDKDIVLPLLPNLSSAYNLTALVSTEYVPQGDTSVPLTRFNVNTDSPSELGAYGLPEEITDAGEDHNIIEIDHGSNFSAVANKGFYLSFWIKLANSHTTAANEDIITIGQDDGKQIKIALDSNSLPALYRKDSGTTYSSATLDTPTGDDAPDLTEWTNVTLLKPLGRTGLTRLIINGVEVDSSADITASTFYDVSPASSDSSIKIITSHKYVLSLVKHYVPLAINNDSLTPLMVEKIYELEKPMFQPKTGITYLKSPSNVADKNFITFNEHTKTLSVVNTAATIEYDGLISKRVDTSANRIQPTVAVSSGSNLLVGE